MAQKREKNQKTKKGDGGGGLASVRGNVLTRTAPWPTLIDTETIGRRSSTLPTTTIPVRYRLQSIITMKTTSSSASSRRNKNAQVKRGSETKRLGKRNYNELGTIAK